MHRCVYLLRRGRDIVEPLVALVRTPPPNPSDMSNLEFKVQRNIDKRGMLYKGVPPTSRRG